MNLKVGMYIRTLDGISKVIEVRDSNIVGRFANEDGNIYFMNEIMCAPSFNIIDLIEVEDYVNGKEVIAIYEKDDSFIGNSNYIFKEKTIEVSNDNYETIPTDCLFTNDEIKSIVTKEKFEEIEYKVDE